MQKPPDVKLLKSLNNYFQINILPKLHYTLQFIRPPLSKFGPLRHKNLGRILWLAV